MAVDTKAVAGRRTIRFNSGAEVLADAEMLAAAERGGNLDRLGNWTLGQALGHLAWWVNVPYDGYPADMRPPWFVKLIVRTFLKGKFMNGMPAGVKIPRVEGGTKGTEVLGTEEGLSRLRKAWARLEAGPPSVENIILGPLTHEEWKRMNLRHAELHLSFMMARGGAERAR